MEEYKRFINEINDIMYKSNLGIEDRLKLARNMIMYILGIELEFPEYKNERKDSIVKEQARECPLTESKVTDWLNRAEISRYYLSYLRKGLCAYIQTGDLDSSASCFRCYSEDIVFCYDIIKQFNILQRVREALDDRKPNPVFLSDLSIDYIMKKASYTITKCLNSIRFLTTNGVVEESFVKMQLEVWAHRVIYIKEGMIDMVYLINIVNESISNKCSNIRDYYTSEKRNGGLVRTSDMDVKNQKAEYIKVCVPLTEELSDYITSRGNFKSNGVPEFILSSDLPERDKSKLSKFFSIINGEECKDFESWLKLRGKEEILLNTKSSNDQIDKLSIMAQEFLEMDSLMPKLRLAWKMFYNTSRVYDSNYRLKTNIEKINESTLKNSTKGYLLVTKLKSYPEDFINFLKLNNKNPMEVDCIEWARAYYGKPCKEEYEQIDTVIKSLLK